MGAKENNKVKIIGVGSGSCESIWSELLDDQTYNYRVCICVRRAHTQSRCCTSDNMSIAILHMENGNCTHSFEAKNWRNELQSSLTTKTNDENHAESEFIADFFGFVHNNHKVEVIQWPRKRIKLLWKIIKFLKKKTRSEWHKIPSVIIKLA